MMRARDLALVLTLGVAGCAGHEPGESQTPQESPADADELALPTVAEFAAEGKLEARAGLFTTYVDADQGRVYLQVDPDSPDQVIYYEGLATGLGANPAGLDRGEIGDTQLLRLRRVGRQLLLEAVNTRFRAQSSDAAERRAARDAFPDVVLWAAEIVALDEQRYVADISGFIARDAHQVVRRLKARDEGDWALEAERSVVEAEATLSFPDNLEFEATLTFSSAEPGDWAGSTSTTGNAMSLRVHHSFVRLPDDEYEARVASPRMGNMSIDFLDFAVGLAEPLEQRWAIRHRLQPDAPLVYYVDPGAPQAIREALMQGAAWWADAFEAAGHKGGFEVRVLPEGVHPLDVRYNVINWVHRSTRGWSYGASVVDPRTGEIIKAHVTLGSQRARQDRRIFEALVGAAQSGKGGAADPVQLALARIRQLAAHEVGHTLGFEHNFAASTWGRASVMDYPAPLVHLTDGAIDVSEAYAAGIGAWDKHTARYLYGEWANPSARDQALADLIAQAQREGMVHLSDAETHASGAAHPAANVWDNGADPVAALDEVMAVRAAALAAFGPGNLAPGADPSALELTFAPLYLLHRYQVAATAKTLGGVRYELGPNAAQGVQAVPAAEQALALKALLRTLEPAALATPDSVSALLRPTPEGHIDAIDGWAGPSFDPLGLAASAADLSLRALTDPHRAHRLVLGHAHDPAAPSFEDVLGEVSAQLLAKGGRKAPPLHTELRWLVLDRYVDALVRLAADEAASPSVRASAEGELGALRDRMARVPKAQRARSRALARRIGRWLDRREDAAALPAPSPAPPPGSPIGGGGGRGASHQGYRAAQSCGVGG